MNLRLPLVAAVVVLAAGAAAFRVMHARAAAPPSLLVSSATPQPRVTLSRPSPARPGVAPIVVYVAGEVLRSGVYSLPATARGADALHAAGGPKADADMVAVNLAARLEDGDELAVPMRGEPARRSSRSRARAGLAGSNVPRARHTRKRKHAHSRASPAAASDVAETPPTDLVDLNRADVDELQSLPGIGSALAERIVTIRDQSGPFASTDDLLDVGGMTQSKVDAIAPYVTFR